MRINFNVMGEWIYPTENVREEYAKTLIKNNIVKDIYSNIDELKRQIEGKERELKKIKENSPKYSMLFFEQMLNKTEQELKEDIRNIERYVRMQPDNNFQSERLKTWQDLLKTAPNKLIK